MIKEIEHITALRAIHIGEPKGKFISKDGNLWIAIDNTGKILKKKEFSTKEECKKFLK